jgi:hypothetical protein
MHPSSFIVLSESGLCLAFIKCILNVEGFEYITINQPFRFAQNRRKVFQMYSPKNTHTKKKWQRNKRFEKLPKTLLEDMFPGLG